MNFCNQLVIVGGGGFIGCALVSRIQEYDIDLLCVSVISVEYRVI